MQFNVFASSPSSLDSLDQLLPKMHAESEQQLTSCEKERSITNYLKQLGLKFKTDPLDKEQRYYEYLLIYKFFFFHKIIKRTVHIQIIRESMSPITPVLFEKISPTFKQQEPFSIKENPLVARRFKC